MAFAPSDYSGSVISPGEALVVDRGFNGPDDIWRFSPDLAEGEFRLHADNGTLIDPFDITIGRSEIYVADTGGIYRVDTGGALVKLITSEPLAGPIGIATDPITQELLVLTGGGARLVRINPATGNVGEVLSQVSMINGNSWAGIDITQDGSRIIVTGEGPDAIYVYSR